jgi:hypothetical protein
MDFENASGTPTTLGEHVWVALGSASSLVTRGDAKLASVIEKLREKSPEKYVEAAVRAMAAAEPKNKDGWETAQSMQDIGRKLLQSVGTPDDAITDQAIEDAVAANDEFIAQLQAIRDAAQGPMQ